MSRWDIDPLGVRAVVQRTQAAAAGFTRGGKKYQSGAQQAAATCDSPIVTQALAIFAEHHQDTLAYLVTKTAAALTGAVKATNAYLVGDLEMAERAQRQAVRASAVRTIRPP